MANSADPDQLTSSEAKWSGSTLFERKGISGFSRTKVKKAETWGSAQTLKFLCANFDISFFAL